MEKGILKGGVERKTERMSRNKKLGKSDKRECERKKILKLKEKLVKEKKGKKREVGKLRKEKVKIEYKRKRERNKVKKIVEKK